MRNETSPTVTLHGVGRRFGDRIALTGVSAAIAPGEFVAIVGRSGAGKTTLLRCLSRSIPVSEGAIRFGGEDVAGLRGAALRAHRAGVGMIYQQFNLVTRLRVADNVLVGRLPHLGRAKRWAALCGYFDRAERDAAFRCLDHVGLLSAIQESLTTMRARNPETFKEIGAWVGGFVPADDGKVPGDQGPQ